jgi:hypothetical protein
MRSWMQLVKSVAAGEASAHGVSLSPKIAENLRRQLHLIRRTGFGRATLQIEGLTNATNAFYGKIP